MKEQDKQFLLNLKGTGNYHGVLVERIIGAGWRLLKKDCATPEEVDKVIEAAYKAIEESIR